MLVGKSAAKFFRTISGSQMGSQPLQNTEIIQQTDVLLWRKCGYLAGYIN